MMRMVLMILFCCIALEPTAFAWGWKRTPQKINVNEAVYIKKVVVVGFLLHDKDVYKDLNNKYRRKVLTPQGVKGVVEEVEAIYRAKGYVDLVEVQSVVKKGLLTIRVNLSKQ